MPKQFGSWTISERMGPPHKAVMVGNMAASQQRETIYRGLSRPSGNAQKKGPTSQGGREGAWDGKKASCQSLSDPLQGL
jgi:hypothetical protein